MKKCKELCKARCCKYVTVKIEAPRLKVDFDEIRWFLAHKDVYVMIEDRLWFMVVHNRCRNLKKNNLCGIYEDRFEVCRGYDISECDASDGEWGATVFKCTEDFDIFLEKKKRRLAKRSKRKSKKKSTARTAK